MKASDLNLLFSGIDSGDRLRASIGPEVTAYRLLLQKKGSTIPLYFDEDQDVFVDDKSFVNLCYAVLAGRLSSADLAYICDCLTLSERVEYMNDVVQDIIFELADPEINGGFRDLNQINGLLEIVNTPQ